jgi:DNA-binding transcriptional regulator YiaG
MGISDNIKKLREAAGMTQQDFAEIFGVSYASVSMWESGKRSPEMEQYKRSPIISMYRLTIL